MGFDTIGSMKLEVEDSGTFSLYTLIAKSLIMPQSKKWSERFDNQNEQEEPQAEYDSRDQR